MNAPRRGSQFFPVALVAAGSIVVAAAALTTWWVLLALVPLAMMLGCGAMMAAHRSLPCAPSAARGCCGAPSGERSPD